MVPYEVYACCRERTVVLADEFLNSFLPERVVLSDAFPFPEFADQPVDVFVDPHRLMQRLEEEPFEGYALYWGRANHGNPFQAMLIFTEDGGMVAGLASAALDAPTLLRQLAMVVGARFGFVTLEERPPETMKLFEERCRGSEGTRIIDGELHIAR